MRLVTFVPPDGQPRAGALLGEAVIDLAAAAPLVIEEAEGLRWDMSSLLSGDQPEVSLDVAADIVAALTQMLGTAPDRADFPELYGDDSAPEPVFDGSLSIGGAAMLYPLEQVLLLAPLPRPASLRIYTSFEEHAIAVASLRGTALAPAWYRGPTFAFANHGSILGPDKPLVAPMSEALDYGLGLACVIGRSARDLKPVEAPEVIAAYVLLNTWCARDHEQAEQELGRGPAKSRDFGTSLGPWLVTPDEVELYADDDGRLSLTLSARVNGRERSRGTAATQYYAFAELLAHASRDVTLFPGDVIGSGPIGGGTLLEQTGGFGPWLEVGDQVELEATALGKLSNRIE